MSEFGVWSPKLAEEVLKAVQEKAKEFEKRAAVYLRRCGDIGKYLGVQVGSHEWFVYPPEALDDVRRFDAIKDIGSVAGKYELLIMVHDSAYGKYEYVAVWWRGELVLSGPLNWPRTVKLYDDFLKKVDEVWSKAKVLADRKRAEKIMRRAKEIAESYGIDLKKIIEEVKSKYK